MNKKKYTWNYKVIEVNMNVISIFLTMNTKSLTFDWTVLTSETGFDFIGHSKVK